MIEFQKRKIDQIYIHYTFLEILGNYKLSTELALMDFLNLKQCVNFHNSLTFIRNPPLKEVKKKCKFKKTSGNYINLHFKLLS